MKHVPLTYSAIIAALASLCALIIYGTYKLLAYAIVSLYLLYHNLNQTP